MKIKVLKNTKAAKNEIGAEAFYYQAGETYEVFDELAQVFIDEKWGVLASEEKSFDETLENKAILAQGFIDEKWGVLASEEKSFDETLENKAIQKSPENKSFGKKQKKIEVAPENKSFGKKQKKIEVAPEAKEIEEEK